MKISVTLYWFLLDFHWRESWKERHWELVKSHWFKFREYPILLKFKAWKPFGSKICEILIFWMMWRAFKQPESEVGIIYVGNGDIYLNIHTYAGMHASARIVPTSLFREGRWGRVRVEAGCNKINRGVARERGITGLKWWDLCGGWVCRAHA